MSDPEQRRWVCLGCGEAWSVSDSQPYPDLFDRCVCGEARWVPGLADRRDNRPPRAKRSSVENAARLAEMATLSADAAEERRHYLAAIGTAERLGALLDICHDRQQRLAVVLAASEVERDRLRVIVDLACHDHENLPTDLNVTGWFSVSQALCDAVAAEVARRAQV